METELRRHIADRVLTLMAERPDGDTRLGHLRFLRCLEPLLHHGMTVSNARSAIRLALGECVMTRPEWAYTNGARTEAQQLDDWVGRLGQRMPDLVAMGLVAV
jgi:hypothetical protein